MAYVYSTAQTDTSHGNIDMSVNVFRGDCTRTQTTATFSFGVRFTPNGKTVSNGGRGTKTSNSIAAWYGGVQRFAQASSGNVTASKGTYYYAYYTDRTSSGHVNVNNTTETTCFTATVTGLSATSTSASITIGVGWYDWAGTNKGNLTFSLSIPEYHGNVGKPDVWITDHGNNTFTVGGTDGANGTNNTASTAYSWGYDENYSTAGKVSARTLSANANDATKTVYAKAVTTGAHGSSASDTAYLAIKHYVKPSQAGKPVIHYNKTRLTVKENWKYTWDAATKANDSSPIVGYRIRVYKGNSAITGLAAGSGTTITKGSGTNAYLDRDSTSCEIIFNPVTLGFAAGNTVKVSVQAYAKDGSTSKNLKVGDSNMSDVSTVQNAGVMRVKPAGAWKEGIVHVKVNGAWKEADLVQTKVSGAWKESE